MSAHTPSAQFEPCDGVLSAPLDDEVVVLHIESGIYYGLNEVAAFVWSGLPATADGLVETVVAEFDVDPERASADVRGLLDEFQTRGLLRVADPVSA